MAARDTLIVALAKRLRDEGDIDGHDQALAAATHIVDYLTEPGGADAARRHLDSLPPRLTLIPSPDGGGAA